jgi:hypothetical protein
MRKEEKSKVKIKMKCKEGKRKSKSKRDAKSNDMLDRDLYDFDASMDWETNLEGASKLLFGSDISDWDEDQSESEASDEAGTEEEVEKLTSGEAGGVDRGVARGEEEQVGPVSGGTAAAATPAAPAVTAPNVQPMEVSSGREEEARIFYEKLPVNVLEYEAVNRSGRESLRGMRADGGQIITPDLGSFVSTADGRLLTVGFRSSLPDKKNVTTSFDPIKMECYGCPIHHAEKMWKPKGSSEASSLQGEAFLLTDQSYPPVLPTAVQSCLKIVRREHGTLMELATELLHMTRGMVVGKKTVVLLHSLSHMARAGTEGYIEDFLMASSRLKASLGQHVDVIPLPHLFEAGCDSEQVIRIVAEVTTWASKVFGDDGQYLGESFEIANELLAPMMGAEAQGDYDRILRLPTSTKLPAAKATWRMGGFKLARAIEPVSVAKEARLILSIIAELRKGLALKLDEDPCFDRMMPVKPGGGHDGIDYLVAGRTGPVAMMAEALVRKGYTVVREDDANWRVNKFFVDLIAERVVKAIAEHRPRVVIMIGIEELLYGPV